ncbi:MAG TPA: type II toxin-antitoxin system death-on-curing family toxin [Bryobacteraceae bacterium]|jgi:death-on-curing protein
MKEPEWIAIEVVLAIHEAQLAEHGGATGIRDRALLESALARPKNLFAYSTNLSLNRLAAALAVGIAKNHAFLDGNKRTAWVICALFLELNGVAVVSDSAEVVSAMLAAADGKLTEEKFALWLDKDHPAGL